MSLSLPVRVQGQYPDGATWEDITSTSDASVGGASIKLSRTVLRGQALFLSLPLPKRFSRLRASPFITTSESAFGTSGFRFAGF